MTSSELYHKFWAKTGTADPEGVTPYHLVPYHNLDVAAVGYSLLKADKKLTDSFSQFYQLPEEKLIQFISLLLAWHDLGKFSEGFQNLSPELLQTLQQRVSVQRYTVRHDTAGLMFITTQRREDKVLIPHVDAMFVGVEDPVSKLEILSPTFNAIFGHHGLPPDLQKYSTVTVDLYPDNCAIAACTFLSHSFDLFLGNPLNIGTDDEYEFLKEQTRKASWKLAGFATLCDWVGSNSELFEFIHSPMSLNEYWESHAKPKAMRAIKKLEILPCAGRKFISMSETCGNSNVPTPLQKLCETLEVGEDPSLYIIEDTTGAGKTEAALSLAHKLIGAGHAQTVYFALPTMATANGVFDRVKKMYRNIFEEESSPSLVLAHSKRDLNVHFQAIVSNIIAVHQVEDESDSDDVEIATGEASCAEWFADSRKKALLASFGVGTIDQALVGVLPLKHQSLRLFGASRAVLILDEVHAYDAYMAQLIEKLLEFQGAFKAPVILVSATLPTTMKENFARAYRHGLNGKCISEKIEDNPYPSLDIVGARLTTRQTFQTREEVKRTVLVDYIADLVEIKKIIEEALRKGKATCWIRNSIEDALEAYELFQDAVPRDTLTLFHSRFCHGHRQQIEERVLATFGEKSTATERQGQLLIATQVVEQSLDIDFDLIVTDLAPIDLIIQRAGRLMRHSRDAVGNRILSKDGRGVPKLVVYGPAVTSEPASRWYQEFSRAGSFVYPHHGHLYLTAEILIREGQLRAPDDFRRYVEEVYGDNTTTKIPDSLHGKEIKAEGEDQGKKSLAMINGLNRNLGYESQNSTWATDAKTPTRLTNQQLPATILIESSGRLSPIFSGEKGWELSEVMLPRKIQVLKTERYPVNVKNQLEDLKENPFHKWRNFLVFEQEGDYYFGVAVSAKGGEVKLKYHPITGLQEINDAAI